MKGISLETAVLIRVHEVRELPPAYLVEGSVLSRDGKKTFGSARIKVFGDAVRS